MGVNSDPPEIVPAVRSLPSLYDQACDVARVDLRERGVARAGEVVVVHRPVAADGLLLSNRDDRGQRERDRAGRND